MAVAAVVDSVVAAAASVNATTHVMTGSEQESVALETVADLNIQGHVEE